MDATTEFHMNQLENRIKSYKDWPFDNGVSSCTSEKMAKAGFIHTPTETEPDAVKCFVCLKELDGWESEDDPWLEHKKHESKCPFIKLNKQDQDMTIEDLITLEVKRQRAIVQKHLQTKIDDFKRYAEKKRDLIADI